MTEKNTELSQESKSAATPASPKPESGARPAAGGAAAGKPAAPKRRASLAGPALIVAVVVAIVLAAALWYQQKRFEGVASQLQQQASGSADAARQAERQAAEAMQRGTRQAEQIAALESSLSDTREQLESLQQAFQIITDSGSELVLLNDIDHLLTIAQQQLQLGGNVANAIISLETAQAQLARANRPGLASLQQTINGDLDRLRAASTIDIALLSSQLDEFANLVSAAPLLTPDDAAPEPTQQPAGQAASVPAPAAEGQAPAADAPWWERGADVVADWSRSAWNSVREDLGAFVTVRRVDDAAALLMSPDQAARFRENLRLRIMTAQLAIMMHQPGIWEAETTALLEAVERRFDPQSAQTRQALKLARQFADTPIDVRLPTVDNSLRAIEALRSERERSDSQDEVAPNEAEGQGQEGASEPDAQQPDAQPDAGSSGAPDAPSQAPGSPEAGSADAPAPAAQPASQTPASGAATLPFHFSNQT